MATEAQQPVSAQVVGDAFAQQYYQILHHSPEHVHLFYQDISKLGRQEDDDSMSITTTMTAIGDKILSLDYGQFSAVIKTVDAQESYNGGVHVLVIGYVTGKDTNVRNFTQSFFLAPQNRGYFVLNDMLRYVDNATVKSALVNDVVAPVSAAAEPVSFEENNDSGRSTPNSELFNRPVNGRGSIVEEEIHVAEQHGFCFGLVEFEDARSSVQKAVEGSPVAIGGGQSVVEEKKPTNSRETVHNSGRFQSGRNSALVGRWECNGRSEIEENRSVHNEEDVTSEEENRFLFKLKNTLICDYIFQKFETLMWSDVQLCDKADPLMEGMDLLGGVKHYSFSDLKQITNSLDEKTNLICKTRYGRLFHGKIGGETDVLVKTWDPKPCGGIDKLFHTDRIADELRMLRYPAIKSHPNVVDLVGYTCDKKLAVIYKLGRSRPKCLLADIIESDEFGWEDRLRVARQIASVVKTFHNLGHVHRALLPGCFMMMIHEEGYHLVASYDFNEDYSNEGWRYLYEKRDPISLYDHVLDEPAGLEKLKKEDVFGYGFLLMLLVSKSCDEIGVYRRWEESPAIIHESFLLKDREIACKKIEKLVLACLKIFDDEAQLSSIDEVVETLEELNVKSEVGRQKGDNSNKSCVYGEENNDDDDGEGRIVLGEWPSKGKSGRKCTTTVNASQVVGLKIISGISID